MITERIALPAEERERVVFEFDEFRVDPVRRVLLRQGEAVAVTPKALSILVVLLERAGEVVEKRELIEKVWAGAFVSEANLTQNVFSLRRALGERANDNRYIVTVPGQGYSFAGEVRRLERCSTGEIPIVADGPAVAPLGTPAAAAPDVPFQEAPPPSRHRFAFAVWGLMTAVLLAAAGLFAFFYVSRATRSPALGASSAVRPAIAVLSFKSLSPNDETSWLATAFAEMLTTELSAGGKMRVIRGDTVAQAATSLLNGDPTNLGPAELKRLHDALGADLVVVGSYFPHHGQLRMDLRVLRAPGGEAVVSLVEVGTQPELFELVSRTGAELRKSLGFPDLSPREIQETRAQTPADPEVSRLYTEGLARLRTFDPPGALKLLQKAVAANPESPVIHRALSQAWSALGYDPRAAAAARKALDLAGSLPRAERLVIEGSFYKAAKQWDKASEVYRSLWTFFPDDVEYGLELAESLIDAGHHDEASAAVAALRELPPPTGLDPRIDLAEARNAWRLSDFATEERAAAAAGEKGRRSGQTLIVAQALIFEGHAKQRGGKPQEALVLWRESAKLSAAAGFQWGVGRALSSVGGGLQVLGDLEGAEKAHEQALAIARQTGSGRGLAFELMYLGNLHLDRGQLAEALPLLEQSFAWFHRIGDRLSEARALSAAGTANRALADLVKARQRFEQALALSQSLGARADEAQALDHLGTVLALQGDLEEARRRHREAFTILSQGRNASLAASALAASAEASARLGDLDIAWEQSAQALQAKRQLADRLGLGQVLGSRAWIAFQRGDLAASRSFASEQLQIAQAAGAQSLAAWALQNLGRCDFAAGNLKAARRSLEEALEASSQLDDNLRAMEVRLDLAGLALTAGYPAEAVRLAREASTWYQDHKLPGKEVWALALLAEALGRQGSGEEARKAAAEARRRLEAIQDREIRVAAAISLARFATADGHSEEALWLLQHATADTAKSGLHAADLEARLALGEVLREIGDPAASSTLQAVRGEAQVRGFRRVAARALMVLPSQGTSGA